MVTASRQARCHGGAVQGATDSIGGSGGSLEPPGPLLEPPGPLLTHLHTIYMAYSECLPTRLNPLAERTCFSQPLYHYQTLALRGLRATFAFSPIYRSICTLIGYCALGEEARAARRKTEADRRGRAARRKTEAGRIGNGHRRGPSTPPRRP